MKSSLILLAAFFAAASITLVVTGEKSAPTATRAQIERGRYLVNFGGCADCHTPMKMGAHGPEPDLARSFSGHPAGANLPPPPRLPEGPWSAVTAGLTAWSGPWGVSYAANITPDENTGLGIWTEEMFLKTMRTGKHMGASRDILPPMPWQGLSRLTDEDLKAVFAYLRTVPPITNQVPEPLGPDGRTLSASY